MIRKLRKEDKEEFISMVEDFYHSEAVLYTISKENITNTFEEFIEDSPYGKVYIIEYEKKTAGYAQISFSFSNEAGGMVIWIEELYIKEQYRGFGLGTKALDFIMEQYKPKAKRFRLELTEENKGAENLYLNKGFVRLEYAQMLYDLSSETKI